MADKLPEPESRKEVFLAKAAGESVTLPEPASREELFLKAIADNGGGGGGGTTYTAGDGIVIDNDEISADLAQSTGQSTTKIMSQKAVSDALASVGGGGITELTSADYNYPTDSPTSIAAWLLDDGVYSTKSAGVRFDAYMNSVYSTSFILTTDSSNNKYAIIFNSAEGGYIRPTGVNATDANRIITDKNLKQTTGTSTTDVMSQNAVTQALASAGGSSPIQVLTDNDLNWDSTGEEGEPDSVATWLLDTGWYMVDENSSFLVYTNSDDMEDLLLGTIFHVNGGIVMALYPDIYNNGANCGLRIYASDISTGETYEEPKNINFSNLEFAMNQAEEALNRIQVSPVVPTTTTWGEIGYLYSCTANGKLYMCTAIDDSDPDNPVYTWTAIN